MSEHSESTQTSLEIPSGLFSRRGYFLFVLSPMGTTTVDLPASGTVVIGRDLSAGLRISDPTVSRVHAEIEVGARGFLLRDRSSRRGTWLRGNRLTSACALHIGDVVGIGNSTLVLQHSDSVVNPGRGGHQQFEQRLQQVCVEAAQAQALFALMIIDVSDSPSQTAAASAIRALLRAEDLVAEYAPGRFEVLLRGLSREGVGDLATRITEQLRRSEIRARVAASSFPLDGRSPDELMAAALRSLNGSRAATQGPEHAETGPIVIAPKMLQLHQLIDKVACSNITVLITGETGTGKEVIAEAVHARSPRSRKQFVKLNCASVPAQLLEAELFGYERGAFTGATTNKPGLLEYANGGSLLLDELGEMSLEMQAKLLRVLEDRKVRRVGGLDSLSVDVRIIASTNRDLERMVAAGTFREDLYWRLCAVTLKVPPLRERREEILPLARRFAQLGAKEAGRSPPAISPRAAALLELYGWPGNIRQLRNVIERASLLATNGEITEEHLPHWTAEEAPRQKPAAASELQPLKDELEALERERIIQTLAEAGQNQTRAAELLKMPRRTFLEKLDRYGIERPRKRRP